MMAIIKVTQVAYWIVLPIVLFLSILFRYNLLSCIYLLFLLALPYSPALSPQKIQSWLAFSMALVIVSGIFVISQVGFQIALLVYAPYGSLLGDYCSRSESIARYVGFSRYDEMDAGNAFRLLSPDVGVFLVSIFVYTLVGKVKDSYLSRESLQDVPIISNISQSRILIKVGATIFFALLFLGLAGIANPSVVSSVYLLVFLYLAMRWAFLKTLINRFTSILWILLSVVTIIQLVTLYLYQLQFVQEYIPPTALYSRLVGLTAVIMTDCNATYALRLQENVPWTHYVSPALIFVLHWTLIFGVQGYYLYFQIMQQQSAAIAATTSGRYTQYLKNGEKRPLVLEEELPQNYDTMTSTASAAQQSQLPESPFRQTKEDLPVDNPPPLTRQGVFFKDFDQRDLLKVEEEIVEGSSAESSSPAVPPEEVAGVTVTDETAAAEPVEPVHSQAILENIPDTSEDVGDADAEVNAEMSQGSTIAPMPSAARRQSMQSTKSEMLVTISAWFSDIKRYSFYVLALVIMMLWSVTYHSWLTFILLIGACVLWMTKDKKKYTLYCSPFLAVYGTILVLLQFIYSLDLTESELPTQVNESSGSILFLSAFGIQRFEYPFLHLGAQLLYLSGFLIVLHQFNYRRTSTLQPVTSQTRASSTVHAADWTYELLCKYWIFVVFGYHLAVSAEGYPTGIKFVYMLLFLINIVAYSISWSFWRRALKIIWQILVGYTMIVLALIYTYQFQSFPTYWKKLTKFSDNQLADLGLVQSPNAGQLLVQILLPTFFLLAVILQLQYFHQRFLQVTSTPQATPASHATASSSQNEDGSADNIEMNEMRHGTSVVKVESHKHVWDRMIAKHGPKIKKIWHEVWSFIERAFEFHVWRLVYITVFVSVVYQISALNGLLVLFFVLLLPFRRTHGGLFRITSATVSLILLGIMFYQLQFISPNVALTYNCTFNFYGTNLTKTGHLTNWLGFAKMGENQQFFYHIQGYISIVLMIALEQTINLRCAWRRMWKQEPKPIATAFYPSITVGQVDQSIVECAKFFINYFFYKFGVEACYVMTVLVIWARSDVFSIVYCFLLIIAIAINHRASLYGYWDFYVGILMMIVIWQYLSALGMPPFWCESHNYPWIHWGTNETIRNRLVIWLHLPDYIAKTDNFPTIADFFQLLFVVSQLFVFDKEEVISDFVGDNKVLTGAQMDRITIDTNPKKNFTYKEARSVLDQTKLFVFKYQIWITMAIIFLAGASRISVFTLGYLIIFFYLLARQQELIMGKPSNLLKLFSGLIGYTVAAITMKAILQLASCVYIETLQEKACVFVQFMSLSCAKPTLYGISAPHDDDICELQYTNSGFYWDFVCILFLLVQRRIFASYYFLHVAEEMRVSMTLAARGAELFNERLIEEVKEREMLQEKYLLSIKESMENIKQSYHNLAMGTSGLVAHADTMRSGDYYMFHDDTLPLRHTTHARTGRSPVFDPVKQMLIMTESRDRWHLEDQREDLLETEEMSTPPSLVDVDDVSMSLDPPVDEESKDKSDSTVKRVTMMKQSPEKTSLADESTRVEDEEDDVPFYVTFKRAMRFLWKLFLSGIDSFILILNKSNQNYRNIVMRLSAEKDLLCEARLRRQKRATVFAGGLEVMVDVEDGTASASKIFDYEEDTPLTSLVDSQIEFEAVNPRDFDKDQHRALRLFYAIWFVMISRTDVVCYFLIILNLMLNASILALVLPFAVYLGATFIIPRPAKEFWTFATVYLEVVIVIRFIFQFEFFPWNSTAETNLHANEPFWWPRILGIEQYSSWSVMDLLQLLTIVFHASVLKIHGLWDNVHVKRPTFSQFERVDIPSTSGTTAIERARSQKKKKNKWFHRVYRLYHDVLNQRFTSVTDVYLYMFMCDVINFLIIIFGYTAFGQYATAATGVVSDLQSNNVPTGFLVMLLVQFVMMFIDRAIYLMKNLTARFIFHIILVFAIHIWMFFILPYVNQRPFFTNHVAQTYYFFKAIYFLFSAYQIRAGYPKRVAGNFLTKSYGTVNLFLFKAYRAIPFLAEIAAIMDWMYTGTSMTISEWMKLWAIHAEVFEIKCWREFEDAYPTPRGIAKAYYLKYLVGGLLLFFLLAMIWFPLLLMNIALTIGGITNNPTQMDLKITIGTFEPIIQVLTDSTDIVTWDQHRFDEFSVAKSSHEKAALFLQDFAANQVVTVQLQGESKTVWIISPPQREKLIHHLQNASNDLTILLEWTLTNDPAKSSVFSSSGSNRVRLKKNDTTRDQLFSLLTEGNSTAVVFIDNFLPQYIHSRGASSISTPAYSLYDNEDNYTALGLSIRSQNNTSWWNIQKRQNSSSDSRIEVYVFSNKVSPSSLNFLVSYGIIGLYVSVVLVVGRLVRTIFIGTTASIMFIELPFVDRILGLCNDIFLVREEAEYVLEEDLYAKLIFLYRSPSTLIQWTRKPKTD